MSVRGFLWRLLIFSLIAFPLVSFKSLRTFYNKTYELVVNGREVYLSISKSKSKKKTNTLVIGDSVGKQLYDNETYNGEIYSLTTNQAISMVGQYILLKNFIDSNQRQLPNRIIFVVTPTTFSNNLNQVFTYHYFLKPFYRTEYFKYFNRECIGQIEKIPFRNISQWPFVVNTNWAPKYDSDNSDESFEFISPISASYLIKIKQLCAASNIQFKIFCPPLKMENKASTLRFSSDLREFEKTGLKVEFAEYVKSIIFMPDSLFQDHIHFKKEHIPVDYFGLTR